MMNLTVNNVMHLTLLLFYIPTKSTERSAFKIIEERLAVKRGVGDTSIAVTLEL